MHRPPELALSGLVGTGRAGPATGGEEQRVIRRLHSMAVPPSSTQAVHALLTQRSPATPYCSPKKHMLLIPYSHLFGLLQRRHDLNRVHNAVNRHQLVLLHKERGGGARRHASDERCT